MKTLLGEKVEDPVTGIIGIVTAQCSYLFGDSSQVCVETADKKGKPVELWLNVERVVVLP